MNSVRKRLKDCLKYIEENFACQKCARCCICIHEIMISKNEAKKISKETHIHISNIVENGLTDRKSYYFLKHPKNEPCMFLKNGRCSIYKIRPNSCKKYPLKSIKKSSEFGSNMYSKLLVVIPPKCPALLGIQNQLKNDFGADVHFQEEEIDCTEKLKND